MTHSSQDRDDPEDVVLLGGARTSVGRLGRRWAEVPAVELGARAVAATLDRLDGPPVDHVVMGNVVQAGNGQNPARRAAVLGGVRREVPGITLNDVCLASMSAVAVAAGLLRGGEATSVLVGGFESMSRAPREPVDLLVHDGLWCGLDQVGMGPLSDAENARLGVSRADQDEFAARSHARAEAARLSGRLAEETADDAPDEGIRPDTTTTSLAGLAPAFGPEGTITAGNASQLSDAGSAGIVTTRRRARALGIAPLATVVGRAVVAGPDSSLHLRPAEAAAALLDRNGLDPREVGVWEINEAFAGVVLASARDLDLDLERVNPNGGAVALGHPLGASAFRLVLTLAHELRHRDERWGIAALCGGGGQGQALLLRSEAA